MVFVAFLQILKERNFFVTQFQLRLITTNSNLDKIFSTRLRFLRRRRRVGLCSLQVEESLAQDLLRVGVKVLAGKVRQLEDKKLWPLTSVLSELDKAGRVSSYKCSRVKGRSLGPKQSVNLLWSEEGTKTNESSRSQYMAEASNRWY